MQKYVITNFCIYTNLMYVEKVLSMNISSTNVHTRNDLSKHWQCMYRCNKHQDMAATLLAQIQYRSNIPFSQNFASIHTNINIKAAISKSDLLTGQTQ